MRFYVISFLIQYILLYAIFKVMDPLYVAVGKSQLTCKFFRIAQTFLLLFSVDIFCRISQSVRESLSIGGWISVIRRILGFLQFIFFRYDAHAQIFHDAKMSIVPNRHFLIVYFFCILSELSRFTLVVYHHVVCYSWLK